MTGSLVGQLAAHCAGAAVGCHRGLWGGLAVTKDDDLILPTAISASSVRPRIGRPRSEAVQEVSQPARGEFLDDVVECSEQALAKLGVGE